MATATALPSGDLVVGGLFDSIAGVAAANLARRNGTTWHAFGTGANDLVWTAGTLSGGDLVVGGDFTTVDGTAALRIARWNGSTWSPFGSGANGRVRCVLPLPGNELIVGGDFTTIDGVAAAHIARWNGSTWSPLGAGPGASVTSLARLANGDVVAASGAGSTSNSLGVRRWDGTTWSLLGSFTLPPGPFGIPALVNTVFVRANGDLLVGGLFLHADGNPANGIASWDGSTWSDIGSPDTLGTTTLAELPDGDLLAGHATLLRRDGTTWTTVPQSTRYYNQLLLGADGTVTAVGSQGPGWAEGAIVQLASNCPATSAPQGLGCASSGGANVLAATTLPWVDATFRAQGSGLPGLALVAAVTSLTSIPQAVLPLQTVFAQAPAGCDLLVAPDILQVLVTTTGTAESSLFLPSAPPIVGVTFFHQMVPLELDPLGNIVQVTATNALQLTAGVL
ncbi:MAG: hypothetical protein JNL08_04400 [Planctomycetes bacterium]|nr:hypothetical protein [Planctomycetota bacterium]